MAAGVWLAKVLLLARSNKGLTLALAVVVTAFVLGLASDLSDNPDGADTTASESTPSKRPISATCNGSTDLTAAADAIVDSGDSTAYPAAKRLYEQVIASGSPPDRACAAVGLARLLQKEDAAATAAAAKDASKAGWEQKLQKSWSAWTKANLDPLKDVLLAALGIILVLLVLARLSAGVVVRPAAKAPADWLRLSWWTVGLALIVAAGCSAAVAAHVDVDDNKWWPFAAALTTLVLVLLLAPWRQRHQEWERPALVLAVAGAVATGLAIPAVYVDVALVAGGWAAIAGAVLVACARGTGLAIEVLVRGDSGSDNAARSQMMLARLQELGSENPHDIRHIGKSDVTSLPEDALTAVPSGAVAAALFNLLKVIRPSAPWRVTVSLPDDATLVADITRNRIAVPAGSLVVRAADLPSADADATDSATANGDAADASELSNLDEMLTIAAAHTLLVLSGPHEDLQEGLCGATRWQALALHAISRRPGVSDSRKSALVHAAIDASPRYLLPRMAAVNAIDDSDPDGRSRYAEALNRLWDDFDADLSPTKPDPVRRGYEAAKLRLLYNRSIAWMNVRLDRAIAGDAEGGADAWRKSAKAALGLRERLIALEANPTPSLAALVGESVRPTAFLLRDLAAHAPEFGQHVDAVKSAASNLDLNRDDLKPQTRNDYYGRACFYAAVPNAPDEWKLAVRDLRVAATAPRFAEWAPQDPSMAVFILRNEGGKRAHDDLIKEFKEILAPGPLTTYLELEPFEPYAKALKGYGLLHLSDLVGVGREKLASTASVHPSVAQQWVEAALLYDLLGQLDETGEQDEATRLQLLQLLLSVDVTSRAHLVARLAGDEAALIAFYFELVKEAATLRIVPTWEETIKVWKRVDKPKPLLDATKYD
ncbi:hypothetical protein IEZ26_13550 [Nocardioides cavernae]|uniref:Uncharacterized protein n=1 Tax=Nocardioides cavernae TaxID=1921566 RepID=A0ABR8NBZ9_9ACTN|nr:hypothetical protein [Nocardioides cavernae]MBD3925653.1 hypothetical protein [Nocardioides cavernae]MBM7513236.1 hypothetical protein [Nocardioides cavernae]